MADAGAQLREEFEMESPWIFVNDDGSDVSEEVVETDEDVQTDEETEEAESDDESTDRETDEQSDEDGEADAGSDQAGSGDHGEENDTAVEEQNKANEKKQKKGKVVRMVKGFKNLVGGMFRTSTPSGLKLDVNLKLNVKATYGKRPASKKRGKKDGSFKNLPKNRRLTESGTASPARVTPKSPLPATRQQIGSPVKAPDRRVKMKQKNVYPATNSARETSAMDGPSSSADVSVQVAKLIEQNERLRQRNRLLINTNENLSRVCRSVGCWQFFSLRLRKVMFKFD